jgi:hypothetical protein
VDPGGIDHEAPRLGVFEEGWIDQWIERVVPCYDRIAVVGHKDPEDTLIKPSDGFERLDGVMGGLR